MAASVITIYLLSNKTTSEKGRKPELKRKKKREEKIKMKEREKVNEKEDSDVESPNSALGSLCRCVYEFRIGESKWWQLVANRQTNKRAGKIKRRVKGIWAS